MAWRQAHKRTTSSARPLMAGMDTALKFSSFYLPGMAPTPLSFVQAPTLKQASRTAKRLLKLRLAPLSRALAPLFLPARRLLKLLPKLFNLTEKRPLTVGALIAGLLGSGADAVSQVYFSTSGKVDWQRNLMFATHGVLYIGVAQYLLWCRAFTYWSTLLFNSEKAKTIFMVCMDMSLHIPFLYFPVFYAMKQTMLDGKGLTKDAFKSAFSEWRQNIAEDVKACWAMWGPIQCITFSVVPTHLRVPFVSAVNFAWTVILSTRRGAAGTDC